MLNQFGKIVLGCVFASAVLAGIACAQGGAAAADSTVVANPTYISIPLEIDVNRPAAEVWKRVGKFCDIGEWFRIPCTITSGKDGEFGAVRSVAGEILVGKTELSYTYTQTVKAGRPYNLYHGTLEARPVTATTSKLVYTLMFESQSTRAAREHPLRTAKPSCSPMMDVVDGLENTNQIFSRLDILGLDRLVLRYFCMASYCSDVRWYSRKAR